MKNNPYIYIFTAALVSYLIRVLPLTLIRKPIKNKFLRSFLFYIPYVTLAVMTFPAIINATQSPIAGIIALDSEIIMFDEPTAALDGPSKYNMMKLFRELADNGKTVIFSTHHPEEANFADRVIHFSNGSVEYDSLINNKNQISDKENEKLKEQKPLDASKMLASLRNLNSSLATKEIKNSLIASLNPSLKYLIFILLFGMSVFFDSLMCCGIMVGVSFVYCILSKYILHIYHRQEHIRIHP